MRKLSYLLILCSLILGACLGESDYATQTAVAGDLTPVTTQEVGMDTAIPFETVTPTQEAATWTPEPIDEPGWDTSCLPEGVATMNLNPCLEPDPQNGEPYEVAFAITPNRNWWGRITEIAWRNDRWEIDLHGGSGFAGFAGFRITDLELVSGYCYGLNLPGFIDLRDMLPEDEDGNVTAQLRIHKSDGTVITLNEHSMRVWDDSLGDYTFTGQRDFFWAFYSNDADPVIDIEVGINIIWASTKPGNNFAVDGLFVQRMFDGSCVNTSGF